jgi:hypothetical protein
MVRAVPTDDSMQQDTTRYIVKKPRVSIDRKEAQKKAKIGEKSAAEGSERRLQVRQFQ